MTYKLKSPSGALYTPVAPEFLQALNGHVLEVIKGGTGAHRVHRAVADRLHSEGWTRVRGRTATPVGAITATHVADYLRGQAEARALARGNPG